MKKILIIGAGILQVPAIVEAKKMGLNVAVFDYDKNAPGFKIADEAYEISTLDIETAVSKAREIKIDGVMTLASDMPLRTVAAIARELGLHSISDECSYVATNKARMRERLKECGVPIPQFYIANSISRFKELVSLFIGKKFIVKPADNSASRGVQLCDTNMDLDSVYNFSKSYSSSGEILVEEYMEGKEVSVETFSVDGEVSIIAITDKLTTSPPFFVEMGHSQPSTFCDEIQTKIIAVASSAVKALGIENGPSHVEVMVTTKDGPKIVELGARLGGDNISTHLVPLSTGVNLVECSIRIALGDKPNLTKKFNRAAVIRYLKCHPGEIISVNGVEGVNDIFGVEEFQLLKDVGEKVSELQCSNDRIGYVICSGDTLDEVLKQCNKACDTVKITCEPVISTHST